MEAVRVDHVESRPTSRRFGDCPMQRAVRGVGAIDTDDDASVRRALPGRRDDCHGTRRMIDTALADRAQQQSGEAAASPRADHQQGGILRTRTSAVAASSSANTALTSGGIAVSADNEAMASSRMARPSSSNGARSMCPPSGDNKWWEPHALMISRPTPRTIASSAAHRSATFDAGEPSMPTTIRASSGFFVIVRACHARPCPTRALGPGWNDRACDLGPFPVAQSFGHHGCCRWPRRSGHGNN